MPIDAEQARRFYDRFGARQDMSARFEDRARDVMAEHAELAHAERVFEFGFGTGRFASQLLERWLPSDARYVGQDVSTTMFALAQTRLEQWPERVTLRHSDGALVLPDADASFDRFVSTYVLDLMPEPDIAQVLGEAHRVLVPGGLLGLVSLTHGERALSRAISGMWSGIASLAPVAVGGCRPIDLRRFVTAPQTSGRWDIRFTQVVTALAVPSQVLVARRV